MSTNKYPYQDLSLGDRKGERWRDIPNLEGYYVISNFGRVKRLAFATLCSNGQLRHVGSKIMAADIRRIPNQSIKDEVYWLRVKVLRDGIKYELALARLVYYSFVKKFELGDLSTVILPKDGDGRNVRPGNLVLANMQRKAERIHERGRMIYQRPTSYDEFLSGQSEKSSNAQCKPVSQYTLKGKMIKTYPSIVVAARIIGISAVGIVSVLKDRQVSCGGYVWRYGSARRIDMKVFLERKEQHFKNLVGQKVTQYRPDGNKVAFFLTINDAARATKTKGSCICEALAGRQKSAGGFIWKRGLGKKKIDLRGYRFGEALRAEHKQVKVRQYSLDGRFLRTFPSVKAAAKHVGIAGSTISSFLGGRGKQAGGFRWKKCN
jgi:hypothetical protein